MTVSKEIIIAGFMRIQERQIAVNMVLTVNLDFVSKSNGELQFTMVHQPPFDPQTRSGKIGEKKEEEETRWRATD